jgi:UDP-N-acetyl-D-glucosamine dehydrogenase
MPFYPGPGIGGHCIPLDPTYLSWKAKSFGFYNRFIELATDINGNMPRFAVAKLMRVLNRHDQHLKGSRILLLGLAYKANVGDTRESPGLEMLSLAQQEGALVSYHDPFVDSIRVHDRVLESVPLTRETLAANDCVVITTHHDVFDLDLIVDAAPLILDTRNAFKGREHANLVRL